MAKVGPVTLRDVDAFVCSTGMFILVKLFLFAHVFTSKKQDGKSCFFVRVITSNTNIDKLCDSIVVVFPLVKSLTKRETKLCN